jgi:polygalacturonase
MLLLLGSVAAAGGQVFDVVQHGAVGDGSTSDTAAVRGAAAALAAAGGGTLRFPAAGASSGRAASYLTGPVNISSNTRVEIEAGATILGSQNGSEYPLLTASHSLPPPKAQPRCSRPPHRLWASRWPCLQAAAVWPAYSCASDAPPIFGRLMHQSMLFTWNTSNISIGGGGTIDCNGGMWRACAKYVGAPLYWNLSAPPCNGHGRPHCVFLANATDVTFEDVTVLRPGDWNTHFSSVTNLRVRRVNITSPHGENADGIDVDSCRDVVVEDSFIHSGDDAIAMKSGRDYWGRLYDRPTRDVLVRNVTFGAGYGVTIGSETSGSIINVTFEDLHVLHQAEGVHIKTMRGRGGVIENITYRNLELNDTRHCIDIGVGASGNRTNASATPRLRNIRFENVHCARGTEYSYSLVGLPEQPIENLTFINVTMAAAVKPQAACENVRCTCDRLTQPCPSCCRKV